MFQMLRSIFFLAGILAIIGLVSGARIGSKTLWEHVRAIASAKETMEFVDGVKQSATKAIKKGSREGLKALRSLSPPEKELEWEARRRLADSITGGTKESNQ